MTRTYFSPSPDSPPPTPLPILVLLSLPFLMRLWASGALIYITFKQALESSKVTTTWLILH